MISDDFCKCELSKHPKETLSCVNWILCLTELIKFSAQMSTFSYQNGKYRSKSSFAFFSFLISLMDLSWIFSQSFSKESSREKKRVEGVKLSLWVVNCEMETFFMSEVRHVNPFASLFWVKFSSPTLRHLL